MTFRRVIYSLTLVTAVTAVCLAAPPRPPVNMSEYRAQQSSGAYPGLVISQYNLRRVMDSDLTVDERVASLAVVRQVGAMTGETREMLAALMTADDTPPALREAMMSATPNVPPARTASDTRTVPLTRQPVLALTALDSTDLSAQMELDLLKWIGANADEEMLADVIKQWARQPADGPNEARYRAAVKRIGGSEWDQVLLAGMGRRAFYARGSSQVLLASRLTAREYRSKLLSTRPSHESLAALQTFLQGFDYIPPGKAELLKTVTLYVREKASIEAASVLYAKWRDSTGYKFQVRDFHLLSALAKDSDAAALTRVALVADLAQTLAARQHVPHYFGGAGQATLDARFYRVADKLSMADLWNVRLLDELLSRTEIQAGLGGLAERDLADTDTAWGGLVFLERGRAAAKKYPPAETETANDLIYTPTERMLTDSRNSLCQFITHFGSVNNAGRAGPTPDELADAKANDYYGMTITRLNAGSFTAHYFTPGGIIVSLGTFPFTPDN